MIDFLPDLPDWLASSFGSVALIAGIGALFRRSISDYFATRVQHGFDAKLEDLRAAIREKEQELDQISSFLMKSHFDRTGPLIERRLEAAETALSRLHMFAKLSIGATLLQSVNMKEVLKDPKDPRVQKFFQLLAEYTQIDEKLSQLTENSQSNYRLYLSDEALKNLDIYISILSHATMFIKSASLGQAKMLKEGSLGDQIVKVLPNTKDSFDTYGDSHGYHWIDYFYARTFEHLRLMSSGDQRSAEDVAQVSSLTISTRLAQKELDAKLNELPQKYLNEQ